MYELPIKNILRFKIINGRPNNLETLIVIHCTECQKSVNHFMHNDVCTQISVWHI